MDSIRLNDRQVGTLWDKMREETLEAITLSISPTGIIEVRGSPSPDYHHYVLASNSRLIRVGRDD